MLGDIELKDGKTPFARAKDFYRGKKIREPFKTSRILQETLLDSFGFRNRFTKDELSNWVYSIGTDLRILPHLENFYSNKFDFIFKIVK